MKIREKQSIVFYLFPEQGKGSTDFYLFLTSIEEGGIKKKNKETKERDKKRWMHFRLHSARIVATTTAVYEIRVSPGYSQVSVRDEPGPLYGKRIEWRHLLFS